MHQHATPSGRNLVSQPFARLHADRPTADNKDHGSASSDAFSSPVHLSPPSSRQHSRTSSPFTLIPPAGPANAAGRGADGGLKNGQEQRLPDPESFSNTADQGFDEWDNEWNEDEDDMPSDLRPSLDRHDGGRSRSSQPLLSKDHPGYDSPPRPQRGASRHSTLHERDPDLEARNATKRRYMLASIFLVLSLFTFAVQTETAVYITRHLHWEKSYCML